MGWLTRQRFKKLYREGDINSLLNIVKDENSSQRIDALRIISLTTDPCAIDVLTQLLLKDSNIKVRIHAAQALGKLGDSNIVEPLINSIRNESLHPFMAPTDSIVPTEEQKMQRMGRGAYLSLIKTVAKSLKRIGENAVDPLVKALTDPSPRIRGVAILALNKIRSQKSIGALEKVVNNFKEELSFRMLADYTLNEITGQCHFRVDRIFAGASKGEILYTKYDFNRLLKGDLTVIERIQQGMTVKKLEDSAKQII
jgi:HEAT repeat protein